MPLSTTKPARRYTEITATREFQFAWFFSVTVAALNALVIVFGLGYLYGQQAVKTYAPGPYDYTYDLMRIEIGIALVIIVVALYSRRLVGLCLSVIATILIEVQYVRWYQDTQRWLSDVHLSDLSQATWTDKHFAGVYQAAPWDFVLFVCATLLFIWQLRVVIAFVQRSRQKSQLV